MYLNRFLVAACLATSLLVASEGEPTYRPAIYDTNLNENQVSHDQALVRYGKYSDVEVVLLGDDTLWCVQPLQVRHPNLWERLKSHEITQPEVKFFGRPSEWQENAEVNVYRFSWTKSGLDRIYEFDTSKLTYCTHILENVATGECIFARPMKNVQLVQLIDSWVEKAYNRGYHAGYDVGYEKAKQLEK